MAPVISSEFRSVRTTIIVKDDKTDYPFDTASIEHLHYPRDLRYPQIVAFKAELADKIVFTYNKATSDPTYSAFLKHFGEFKVVKIDEKEVSGQEFIIEELKSIRATMQRMERARPTRGGANLISAQYFMDSA
jgi:hypothetical protein